MSNILITFEVRDNTTDNNITSLKGVLAEMNTHVRVVKSSHVNSADLDWSDVILANRPNSIYSLEVIKSAKKTKRFVILSLDDDIINLPTNHPNYWKRKYTLKCLELGDVLMSTSPLILNDYCEKYHLRPLLVNSYVKDEDIKKIHKVSGKVKIVYPAGKDHIGLFNKYLHPFFDEFLRTYSDIVDVTFIGIEPQVEKSEAVHFVKGMPYKEYLEFMRTNDFDIGLAPLDDEPFCARKYFAKYIEYAKYGILGLYSAVKPYTYAVREGENGILVNGAAEQWKESLLNLINEPDRIYGIVSNSQRDMREKFSILNAVNNLSAHCPELESFQKRYSIYSIKISHLAILCYRMKDFYVRLMFHLKDEGLSFVFHKTKLIKTWIKSDIF